MSTTNTKFLLIAAGLLGLLLFGVPHAMSLFNVKLPLTGVWKERFQDVNKLNDYAKTHPVELSNVKIENETIDGATLTGATFENTEWKSVSIKKANLTKTVFRQGLLEDVDFSDSTLTDVVFEDVIFRGVRFFGPTLNNVRFVRCTINGSNLDRTKASRIEVEDSRVINTSLSDGELVAVFRNSKLYKDTELTNLRLPSSLTFVKSELDHVELSRSTLNELILDSVKSTRSGFDTGTIGRVDITGGDISFGFSSTEIEHMNVHDLNSIGLGMPGAVVKKMSLSNCRGIRNLNLFEASVDTLDITRCPADNFSPAKSTITTLRIRDGAISNSEFQRMKAKSVLLENVTLGGKLDFTGAHIGDLKTENITKEPGLELITTGSNVKL